MSADNGVYILPVVDRYDRTTWFVNHMQAVENLCYMPNLGRYNQGQVLMFVVEADKFDDRLKALEAAHNQCAELEVCEYGVQELPAVHLPKDW